MPDITTNFTTVSSGAIGDPAVYNGNLAKTNTAINTVQDNLELLQSDAWNNVVANGLIVTAGTGLQVLVSSGTCYIAGARTVLLAQASATVAASNTNYIYIDTDADIIVNTTGVKPNNSMLLATCVTDSSSVTSVNTFPNERNDGLIPVIFTWIANGNIVPDTYVDGIRTVPYKLRIIKAILTIRESGTAGTTQIDINYGNAGSAPTSIFTSSTKPQLGYSGNDYNNDVRRPDVTTIYSGQILSMDIDTVASNAKDAVVQLVCTLA